MTDKKRDTVFEAEHRLVARCRALGDTVAEEDLRAVFPELLQAYVKLLRQTEKITKVGDSIQRKLVRAREEILIKNNHLMDAQKQLLHKEKMVAMNTLVQGLAHEICNPLNFINNFAHLNLELCAEMKQALKTPTDPAELTDRLEDLHHGALIIREHGLRAASIVESMGRVIGVGRGRQGLRIPEDPVYLLESFTTPVVRQYADAMEGRLTVQRDYAKGIPPLAVVVEDLGTVFTQLATNACQALQARYAVEPDFRPILRLTAGLVAENLEIHIDDNGDGIPEAHIPKVFTPFFTTRESAANLGLGLSTSYDIVVNGYDGEIRMVPDQGGFTRFTVVLPFPA